MVKYDVIIVGAGPGGSTAAKCAAEKGFKTIMFERSAIPGQKNCSGTALSPKVFRDFRYLKPDLGLESVRIATKATAHLINEKLEEKMFFGFSPAMSAKYPEAREFLTVNVYRAELDPYLSDLAIEAGAELKGGVLIRDLLRNENGRIVGVITENNQKFYGEIVIGADGVVSTVAQRSGLRRQWAQEELTLMVTIDFEASREKIDRVFGGNALHYWFSAAFPVAYSFFHGNGIHVGLGHFVNAWDKNPKYYLNKFLETPALKQQLDLVEAKPREIQAHLLTFIEVPRKTYSTQGVLLVGDAAGFPCPLEAEGIYYAMLSGKLAVDICEKYITTQDPSVLVKYESAWKKSAIGEEFELGPEIYRFIREIPFSMETANWLIPCINEIFYNLLNVGESHTYNFAHFTPNLLKYKKLLPAFLKYVAPAIAPILERVIDETLKKYLPNSLQELERRSFQYWKTIRQWISKNLNKLFRANLFISTCQHEKQKSDNRHEKIKLDHAII
ncbi:MAG: FAD-dependent monooxygenase [Candidatus Helarchaeota archaeon]